MITPSSVCGLSILTVLFVFQEPEPLFKVCVDELVKELHVQKLSEPVLIEKK